MGSGQGRGTGGEGTQTVRSRYRASSPQALTLAAISAEVSAARIKFPGNRRLIVALLEEAGELAKALLQGRERDEVEREAIQVAAVAVRIIEEGDGMFSDLTAEEAKR